MVRALFALIRLNIFFPCPTERRTHVISVERYVFGRGGSLLHYYTTENGQINRIFQNKSGVSCVKNDAWVSSPPTSEPEFEFESILISSSHTTEKSNDHTEIHPPFKK